MAKYARPGRRSRRPGLYKYTFLGAVFVLAVVAAALVLRGGSGGDQVSAPTVVVLAEPTAEPTYQPTAAPTEAPTPKVTPKYRVVMPTPLAEP